jgi:hypothetical protein
MYPSAALGAPADVFDSALVCVGVFMRNWHIVCVEAIGNHLFEGVPRDEPLPMSATDWQRFTTVRIPKRYHQLNCTQVWAGAKVACGSSRRAHSSANYPNGAPYAKRKGNARALGKRFGWERGGTPATEAKQVLQEETYPPKAFLTPAGGASGAVRCPRCARLRRVPRCLRGRWAAGCRRFATP